MKDKIIFQGKSKKGTEIIIRYPNKKDAKQMMDYINTLSKEKTFITFQGEQVTLEEEIKHLKGFLQKIKDKKGVHLLVFSGRSLIGISNVYLGQRTQKHVGLMGISIAKNFRGEGIGRLLLKNVINEAIVNLEELEILLLGVFSNNSLAYNLYREFGFIEEGRLPKGVKLKNGYVDHIYMYKNVK
ncbi:MAG: GNAT family N-acetyltransferase [Candidatus Levybacteria bacterium]|nr:GNAT family N-acetyltransferase [Candidatus Levybacteria bacterium]